MGNLLDFGQSAGGGLLNFLNNLGQASMGTAMNPPAVDPELAQFMSPDQLAAVTQNYRRNASAGFQAAAARGQSLGGAGAFAQQAADPQFHNDIMQSINDAMLIRRMRMLNQMGQGGSQDPFDQMQTGAQAAALGLPGAAQIQDAAKAQIGPAELAYHSAVQAKSRGNDDAAASYYIKFLQETGRLTISKNGGTMTLLGGSSPTDLQYLSVNPDNGIITGASGQRVIPGAPGAKRAISRANALGAAGATVVPVQNGDGSTTQMPGDVAVSQLGGGGAGGPPAAAPGAAPPGAAPAPVARPPMAPPNPALQPVSVSAQRAPAPGAAPQPPQVPPSMAASPHALADTSYRLSAPPQTVLGRSLTPAQEADQKNVATEMTELPKEGEEATRGAATTLTYIRAAQAVLNSKGGVPTGLTAPLASAISRGMAAVGMGQGDWAAKSQLLVKYLGNLALSNAKATYGPRITQNEVRLQLEELSPSQAMQDGTISEMLDKLGRISQYAIDSADRSRYYLKAGNDPRDFAKWNQQYFPMAEATTPTGAGAHPDDIQALLKKYGG